MSLQTAYTQAFLHIYTVERKNDLASPEGTPNQQSRSLIHICFVFCHKFHSVHRLKVLPQMRIKVLPQEYPLFKLLGGEIYLAVLWYTFVDFILHIHLISHFCVPRLKFLEPKWSQISIAIIIAFNLL